jgi:demethylmenaquinone methyltransferase/2-methoxy-6-polyprenyl-1,4-benzoquinol methylase
LWRDVNRSASPSATPAWNDQNLADPHADPDKARRVERMFSAIAPKYDLNNRIHSFGRDQAWRRAAVRMADLRPHDRVVDVACGTGDLTIAFRDALAKQRRPDAAEPPAVLGVDFTYAMLPIAQAKSRRGPHAPPRSLPGSGSGAVYFRGDALALPLPDASADVLSIAFGLRNVVDPVAALAEFHRVLRPGGRLVVLEFTVPRNRLMRLGYDFYCGWVMPRTASWIAGDRSGAYRYLPRSVNTFADRDQLLAGLAAAGFDDPRVRSLTGGIAACYRGTRG